MDIYQQLNEQAQNLSILYVEDDKETRAQTISILELFFSTVYVGIDGEMGLDLYKNNDIDLVVTDLTMPNMNGAALVKEIKKINSTQAIIVLTAHNSSEELRETINLHVDGFLLKPLKIEKILNLLLKITSDINLKKNAKR